GVVTAELEKIRNEETAELSAIVPCAIEKPNSLMARLSLVTAFGPSTASITPPVFSGYVGLNASNDALRNER
ncbi:MAG TPA: hypothetical protein PLO23_11555, partial [Alphaproteobacteria bacterium]|nr:hypothetical protein [Alphaproteobacteria bacterium]